MATSANDYTLTYYSAPTVVDQIPESFRIYDRKLGMLTKIEEGRSQLMRLLWNYTSKNGNWVATDTETRWGLEYGRLDKIFFTSDSTGSASNANDILHVTNEEGRRLQAGDILNLMGHWVSTSRAIVNTASKTKSSTYAMPEQIQIITNYGEGSGNVSGSASATATKLLVRRNFGGASPAANAGLAVVIAGTGYDASTPYPFMWKAGNSMAEGMDDQLTYSDIDSWDYNYCQIVMRKWSATETEQNINRFFSQEKTFQKNGRKALQEFIKELDVMFMFNSRKTEVVNGRRKWYFGGLAEFIPAANHIAYDDSLFITQNFNDRLKNMFYYGSQTKLALCGADFYTKFSNMIDNKILLPSATNGWGVELQRFTATNGGTLLFAPSDTLSLHGMSDYCYVYDPANFQYGHLQNMDIKTISVPQTNPHAMEAEIYGQITAKRTNPLAHWVFLKASS